MTTRQDPRTLNPHIPLTDLGMLKTALMRVANALDMPMSHPIFDPPTSEVSNKRTITLRVADRNDSQWSGLRWLVMFWISTTQYGAPAAANSITASKGTLIETLTASASYLALTDSEGVLALDIEVLGAQTLYPHALVLGSVEVGDGVNWV